jgi:hypothetical protein
MPLTLFLASLPALTGGVTLFQGPPGGIGNVLVVDPSGASAPQAPALLQQIRLLPIDFNGRTELEELMAGRPRYRPDVPLASRLELPQGRGSLYRYVRADASAPDRFGFLLVDAAGDARSIFEIDGTGTGGTVDPFVERIAVAPAGDAFLAATRLAAGGDLYEVELGGSVKPRSQGLAPAELSKAGLALHDAWGIAAGPAGVLRFDRAQAGDAQGVAFPSPAPAWFSGEIVLSRSGTFAATTAGSAPAAAFAFAFAGAGPAVRMSAQALPLSGAGFLPESLHGPYLAISDDGTTCAWRTEGVTREAFLARAQQAAVHVTDDVHYDDTLDEVGQFRFRPPPSDTVLMMAVGERSTNGPPVIEGLDFYDVALNAAGQPVYANLSLTNGTAQPPYPSSELDPEFLRMIPATGELWLHNSDSGGGDLLAVKPTGGLVTLIANVKEVDFIEPAGPGFAVSLRRSSGNKDRHVFTFASPTAAPVMVHTVPDHIRFERPASRPDGWFAFVEVGPTSELLWRVKVTGGGVQLLTNRPLFYGPALDFLPSGELAFNAGGPSPSVFGLWPTPGLPKRLPILPSQGFVMPGA